MAGVFLNLMEGPKLISSYQIIEVWAFGGTPSFTITLYNS